MTGIRNVQRREHPDDSLVGRLCTAMMDALEAHPEWHDRIGVIIAAVDDRAQHGVIYSANIEDHAKAQAMLTILNAELKGSGMRAVFVPDRPQG
jgi:hypothetical protein